MELRQLRCFVAVAEERSFTRAAARLRRAQPGVSAQIRRLERELGDPLLDRSGRVVRLTQVGDAVLPYARAALEAAAGTRLAADALLGLVRGRVAIGMVTACSSTELLELLAAFHRDHPSVEIALSEDRSDRLLEAVREGRVDLAVIGTHGATPAGLETRRIADEPLHAAVAPTDPLIQHATIGLEALEGRILVCLPRGTGIRAALDEACAAAGVRPRITVEASSLGMVADLAARGLGVAVLPGSLSRARAKDLRAAALAPAVHAGLAFAWPEEGARSPAARALVARARGAMRTRGARPAPGRRGRA